MSKSKPMTLEDVLESARQSWSGEEGERRAQSVKLVIDRVCTEYGNAFGMTRREVFDLIEGQRDYCAVNFYQDAKFPPLDGLMIYDNIGDWHTTVAGKGFRCPSCEGVSEDPQSCTVDECDWKAFGLLGTLGKGIKILFRDRLNECFVPVSVFKPIALENDDG